MNIDFQVDKEGKRITLIKPTSIKSLKEAINIIDGGKLKDYTIVPYESAIDWRKRYEDEHRKRLIENFSIFYENPFVPYTRYVVCCDSISIRPIIHNRTFFHIDLVP